MRAYVRRKTFSVGRKTFSSLHKPSVYDAPPNPTTRGFGGFVGFTALYKKIRQIFQIRQLADLADLLKNPQNPTNPRLVGFINKSAEKSTTAFYISSSTFGCT